MIFDVCGALPRGITVLEASAGTGKTFTIAALAARYVADGVPIDKLLVVTFTRLATGELRERVRERLVNAERALAGPLPADADAVTRLLAEGAPEVVALRRARLEVALSNFDAATIDTTHGFCQDVLSGLGVLGDIDPDTTLVEDLSDLVQEVADDLYLRKFWQGGAAFTRREAQTIARSAVENVDALLYETTGGTGELRRRFAQAVRDELAARKRRLGVIGYDDLLTRLSDTLHGPSGEAAAQRLRDRYSIVLVDEFQDTDPVQWDIMRKAFGRGTTLVLIGDPKQAIYAFRGADVYAYLKARDIGAVSSLGVNWRSDQPLIDAYDAVFAGAHLGHEGIGYLEVRAADANRAGRLHGAPDPAPLRVRLARRDQTGTTPAGYAPNVASREFIARDLAADVARLLNAGAEIGRARVEPRGVAVLVRANHHAALVRDALAGCGVPAVINGAGSVFATPQAQEWLRLLEALERPAQATRARSVALTSFLGWDADRLAAADEVAREEIHAKLHRWARVLRGQGVAALLETVMLGEGVAERMLAVTDGERRLTDLRHVGQLLHRAVVEEQLGTTALTSWLRRRIDEAGRDTHDEERSRRLESDADAVQVLTIHRAKGLEFPVVYFPFLWEGGYGARGAQPVVFHDPDNHDRRTLDVSLEGADFKDHQARRDEEDRGEDLRLLYVALTRARHQAVLWWACSFDSRRAPLGRLLFARADDGTLRPEGPRLTDDAVRARFEALAAAAPGRVSVDEARLGAPVAFGGARGEVGELAAARFDREIDWAWRRTSYSDITAGTYEARVGSEPEEPALDDEPDAPAPVAAEAPAEGVPAPLGEMPVGVRIGTFVHEVLERTDFIAGEVALRVDEALSRRALDVGDRGAVVRGLDAALRTPLVDGVRLVDVPRSDRLDELAFELPLAGGDDPDGWVTLAAIRSVLRAELPAGLSGYADRLEDPALRQRVRGYLTGSIDCVLRVGRRFHVVDYKTNWLGPPDAPLTTWHYRPAALAAEMQHGHYVLQGLLYLVALHRYLRWRLPDYAPDEHLAGMLYLFVRGMVGEDTPPGHGVFAWRPPGALVEALSDVLDGVPAAAPLTLFDT